MSAFNAVRFRVKPGHEQVFLDAHKKVHQEWPGLKHANIIKTGEQTYCIIAEWTSAEAIVQARPNMIATLNSFRESLEDLGGGLGLLTQSQARSSCRSSKAWPSSTLGH